MTNGTSNKNGEKSSKQNGLAYLAVAVIEGFTGSVAASHAIV